jgi:hypothetical protein
VRGRLLLGVVAASLAFAPAALADSSRSSNWAGYAVHRSGVAFRKVIGAWRQPSLSCAAGQSTYSAFWVGIGGYSENSKALEQIGTEADCHVSGRAVMSAWYELVPAASKTLKLTIHAGDAIAAAVTVTGQKVAMTLTDETTHKFVRKSLHASLIDTTSAEWIAEAPSECGSGNNCQTLPLADFGSAAFGFAGVQTTAGTSGTISNRAYDTTRITLIPSGPRFVGNGGTAVGEAKPSGLNANGEAFTVTYASAGRASAASGVLPGAVVHGAR